MDHLLELTRIADIDDALLTPKSDTGPAIVGLYWIEISVFPYDRSDRLDRVSRRIPNCFSSAR